MRKINILSFKFLGIRNWSNYRSLEKKISLRTPQYNSDEIPFIRIDSDEPTFNDLNESIDNHICKGKQG